MVTEALSAVASGVGPGPYLSSVSTASHFLAGCVVVRMVVEGRGGVGRRARAAGQGRASPGVGAAPAGAADAGAGADAAGAGAARAGRAPAPRTGPARCSGRAWPCRRGCRTPRRRAGWSAPPRLQRGGGAGWQGRGRGCRGERGALRSALHSAAVAAPAPLLKHQSVHGQSRQQQQPRRRRRRRRTQPGLTRVGGVQAVGVERAHLEAGHALLDRVHQAAGGGHQGHGAVLDGGGAGGGRGGGGCGGDAAREGALGGQPAARRGQAARQAGGPAGRWTCGCWLAAAAAPASQPPRRAPAWRAAG